MKIFQILIVAVLLNVSLSACAQTDPIVGVWEVKNEYFEAQYEIAEYEGAFFGKILYYNDGTDTYKGGDQKDDYFLTDVKYKNGKYINGKMYLPDGSFYEVVFSFACIGKLKALMTVDGDPYEEIWTKLERR